MVDITLPTIPVVLSTAAVDAINPCAIGVLVILLATLLELSSDKRRMLAIGLIYISSVYVTYLAAGLGLLVFIQQLGVSTQLTWIVAVVVIVLGLIELKDAFWQGKGISLQIPKKHAKKLMEMIHKVSVPGAIGLGMFVAAVELPCTGGPYLAITTVLARMGLSWDAFFLLVLYNFIFILPLLVILVLVYFFENALGIREWKERHKKWMRLAMGLVMISLGIVLLLWAMGVIGLSF
ncbi:TPA: hypothetical protein HA361_04280 [Candidatus Woesearchaeota archaeon]|nr:hypothetical protein [Candidatus Woesearchaeota archaeon]HII69004.1 hypothetical protein [Candidatus Woesearchaeota archaeon]